MKTSLNWLNSYLDRPCDAAEAERLLTGVGFPLDGQEPVALSSGKQDVMLDVEITSNRGDCLSHLGLAREVAAASGRTLKQPEIKLHESGTESVGQLTSVANEADDLCPVYTARVIRGVKVGPSPQWLVDYLDAVGLRSVNNVVDVTNYVLLEMGQPLHAFDLGKLSEHRIVIRRARKGERFVAIDETKHELQDGMLVIADATRPVAVAGVMGGLETEVSTQTTDILLESAAFAPLSVRKTSRALKLASDSSYRFERGVDPLGIERASRRAAQLILELAGGTLARSVIRAGRDEPAPMELSMRLARCNRILGLNLSTQEQVDLLKRLNLTPRLEGEKIVCTVPTYRLDLKREIDLIEEIARLHGLNAIAMHERISIDARAMQPEVQARRQLGRVLVGHGYHETINFSFVRPAHGKPFVAEGCEAVMIDDERRKSEPMLRPSLLPSLLSCRKSNQDMGNSDVQLFEAAATWIKRGDRIVETRKLAILRDAVDRQQAVRELRGTLEELVRQLGGVAAADTLTFEPVTDANYAAAATVTLGDQTLGTMGILADQTRDIFDVKTPLAAAEIDVEPLIALFPPQRQVGTLPRFPAIERDLSIVVQEPVQWQQVEASVRKVEPAMLEGLQFLGTYRGKPIDKGFKSVSFRMVFRDPTKTLRHEEVDPQVDAVVSELKQAVKAELRA